MFVIASLVFGVIFALIMMAYCHNDGDKKGTRFLGICVVVAIVTYAIGWHVVTVWADAVLFFLFARYIDTYDYPQISSAISVLAYLHFFWGGVMAFEALF